VLHWFSNSTFSRSRTCAFSAFAMGGLCVLTLMIIQLKRIIWAL
jgi:hypothetical protein